MLQPPTRGRRATRRYVQTMDGPNDPLMILKVGRHSDRAKAAFTLWLASSEANTSGDHVPAISIARMVVDHATT